MRFTPGLAMVVLACTALLPATPADADVIVALARPNRYTDAKLQGAPVASQLRDYMQRVGQMYIQPDLKLLITILDIDLAGTDESARDPEAPRVLRASAWPKIRLSYQLRQGRGRTARVLASGSETVGEQADLSRFGTPASGDPLSYEKALLDDWFRQKFVAGR